MPRILRRALYQKLRDWPELCRFREDFTTLSGVRLAFVDDLGREPEHEGGDPMICRLIRETADGRAMCARVRQGVLAAAEEEPACARCDAGMSEVAVPVRIGGVCAGYFLFSGTLPAPADAAARARARHLLARHRIDIAPELLEKWLEGLTVVPEERLEALRRILWIAARQIAHQFMDPTDLEERELPVAVAKACGYIRAHGLTEDLQLTDVARHCGVSEGHFSRMFHQSTGLTYREYLTQVRLDHARGLLLRGQKAILEIAFDSGFQSVSQFHRAFRKAFGSSPAAWRAAVRERQE